ncbi:hypothetical protein ABZ915_28885 [Streptomyces sp. NPDC046915]|uniref:hypothetical protein n=1 Tax=Streptomyces sp. NPDC046915 TaxID=3155257 RepID=UPI0033C8F93B
MSTLASTLSRGSLPRRDVVAALVRACGGDPATVKEWVEVHVAPAQRESSARAEDVPWSSQALPGLAADGGDEDEGGGTGRQLVPCLLPADQALFVGRQNELSTACRLLDREGPPEMTGRIHLYRTLPARRQTLIVLDNAADARQVSDLLPNGARCAVVVTSRTT